MAIIKKYELKQMSKKDLEKKLDELRLELAKQKASAAVGGTVKSPGKIKQIRKTIARIINIQKSRK